MSRRQIPLRIPAALDARVREAAERSGLSINATVVAALEQAFGRFRLDDPPSTIIRGETEPLVAGAGTPQAEGEKP